MPSHTRSQMLPLKHKAEMDSEVLRPTEAQKDCLQLDNLDRGGLMISSVLEFLDGASLIDFADSHPRPHQLVFESSKKYFEELDSLLSIRDGLEILEKLFSKQNRGERYVGTIVGFMK